MPPYLFALRLTALTALGAILLLLPGLVGKAPALGVAAAQAVPTFADPAFAYLWLRTDEAPVSGRFVELTPTAVSGGSSGGATRPPYYYFNPYPPLPVFPRFPFLPTPPPTATPRPAVPTATPTPAPTVAPRLWYWGNTVGDNGFLEEYSAKDKFSRTVQYFDKGRMEINDPSGNPLDPWYVTTGLLTSEMMRGSEQLGPIDFNRRCPPDIPIASDRFDPLGPTYESYDLLRQVNPDPVINPGDLTGQQADTLLDRSGALSQRLDALTASFAAAPGAKLIEYAPATGHNMPIVFWNFLNQTAPVLQPDGTYATKAVNDPWFYLTGYPIAEPYWAQAQIAGRPQTVLIQPYERRTLTYNPENGQIAQVEMANVGQDYYDWRYSGAGCVRRLPFPPPQQVPSTDPRFSVLYQSRTQDLPGRFGERFNVLLTSPDPDALAAFTETTQLFVEALPASAFPPPEAGGALRALSFHGLTLALQPVPTPTPEDLPTDADDVLVEVDVTDLGKVPLDADGNFALHIISANTAGDAGVGGAELQALTKGSHTYTLGKLKAAQIGLWGKATPGKHKNKQGQWEGSRVTATILDKYSTSVAGPAVASSVPSDGAATSVKVSARLEEVGGAQALKFHTQAGASDNYVVDYDTLLHER